MRFKMYKDGKFWVYSAAVLVGLAGVAGTTVAFAETGQPDATQETTDRGTSTRFQVNVDKDNFLKYFNVNGTATYDQSNGVTTFTTKSRNQSGNVKLKEHFNPKESFVLKGGLNLGDNPNGQPMPGVGLDRGGDGVGFLFHPGDINQVGAAGGAIGIGGIPGGFGFKFDTYWNEWTANSAYPDPDSMKAHSFGAFVYNDQTNTAVTWEDKADEASLPKRIAEPSNNQFKEVIIDYNAATGFATIVYDNVAWTRTLNDFLDRETGEMAFGISGSTGPAVNQQQFRIDSMSFYEVAENPKIHQVHVGDTKMTGTGHPGDEFEVRDQTGKLIGSGIIDKDGKWTIDVPADHVINEKDDYTVFANKPQDKMIKRIPDTTTVPETQAEVPTIPVDKDGNEIKTPDGEKIPDMPKLEGKPGDKKTITPEELPDIPGYDKPKEPIEVVIPEDGKPIEIPYEKQPEKKEVPTVPVDKDGNEIKTPDGEKIPDMPKVEGKPGDNVEIDVNDLPDIPGYDKPKGDKDGKITLPIPEDGSAVEVPYEKQPEKKEVPTVPVDKDGNEIKTPDGEKIPDMPKVEGKPGDKKTITPEELPDIPGYDKPKKPIEVVIPEDGSAIEIPYEKQAEKKEVPTIPTDKDGNEIKTPDGEKIPDMPKVEGKPGDKKTITPEELPDIPGYDKPKKPIEVVIPEDDSPIAIPYEKQSKGNTQTVTPNGNGTGKSNKSDKAYPNTGSEDNMLVSAVGAGMLALVTIFAGLMKRRKK